MEACIGHAEDLVESARAVQAVGHPNVAYHLAILSLEELGRREIIGMRSVSIRRTTEPPPWTERHATNHVKKLFWCFFGAQFFNERMTQATLDSIDGFAKQLHVKRLEGLYVRQEKDELTIPSEVISPEECEGIIDLAEARINLAKSTKLREVISQDDVELQEWFYSVVDNEEKRKFIFSKTAMGKLTELQNAKAWLQWVKSDLERIDVEMPAEMIGTEETFEKLDMAHAVQAGTLVTLHLNLAAGSSGDFDLYKTLAACLLDPKRRGKS